MIYKKVSIIGSGKVGSVLGKRLKDKNYEIVSIIGRTESSIKRCADFLGCKNYSTSIKDISSDTNLLLISAPDNTIEKVGIDLSKIKNLKFRSLAAFHTSGALSSKELYSLKLKGAKTFSIHPFQTFASISSVLTNMDGVYYGIEGKKSDLGIAKKIVKDLGGNPVIIPLELKPLYHIAGVFSSNYLISFIQNIYLIFKKLKINPEKYNSILQPIISQTLNNLDNLYPIDALTGPIVRGDSKIIDVHLKMISKKLPLLMRFYISMGIETLELCKNGKKITNTQYNEISKIFLKYKKSYKGI
jgi:predicted short-subunit dehydrogenase-like oxidoreductase (DUF2520 family)